MATIDSLEIQIESNLKNLNSSLTRLSKKVGELGANLSTLDGARLTSFANGVSTLAVAVNQIGSIDSRKFKSLASNLTQLTNVNYSGLIASASAVHTFISAISQMNTGNLETVTTGVANFASAINRFGREGAANAVQNIPLITNAFMQMMAELQHAPAVSQNVIDLANSMAALLNAARGSTGPVRNASTAVRIFGTSAGYSAKKARSLASSIGLLYARLWIFVRLGQKAWSAVQKGMDYIEIVNYMNAAFEQVAQKADLSAFEDLGYDSAQAYANSFYDTASKLTETMSGFSASGEGLTSTGGVSLGVNAAQMMRYQAQFAQLASSMGVSSEYATKLSTALTEIGADLASVKNMDFNDVWDNLSSGLVGMSRSIDKYGANIRATNLQEELASLGITENIQNLNQSDKALLRTIVILKSTKYAWADLADTLDQPANQLRMLKSNVQALATTVGQIFLPIVAKVIPYVNMLVVALQRLFEYLRGLIGVEWISTGTGSVSDLMSDVLDDAEDIASATDDAAGSAKEFKKQLLGIDELNVLSEKDDSGSGASAGVGNITGLLETALDGVLDEYQKVWDDAYSKVEQSYQKFADNVKKAFEDDGMYGVGLYLSNAISSSLNKIKWDEIQDGARNLAENFALFLNGFLGNPALFSSIGHTVAQSLNTSFTTSKTFFENLDGKTIGHAIGEGINTFFREVDTKELADALNAFVDTIKDTLGGIIETTDWGEVLRKITDLFKELDIDTILFLVGVWSFKSKTGVAVRTAILKALFGGAVGDKATLAMSGLNVALQRIDFLMQGGSRNFAETISYLLFGNTAAASAVGITAGAITLAIIAKVSWDFSNWYSKTKAYKDSEKAVGATKASTFSASQQGANLDMSIMTTLMNAIKKSRQEKSGEAEEVGKQVTAGILEGAVSEAESSSQSKANTVFDLIKKSIEISGGIHSPAKNMYDVGQNIVLGIYEGFSLVDFPSLMNTWWAESVAPWFTKEKWTTITMGVKTGIVTTLQSTAQNVSTIWTTIKTSATTTWDNIKNTIKKAIDSIKGFLNFDWKWPTIKTPHISWTEGGATATGVVKAILEALSLPTSLPKLKVDWYAQGGFPDTGSLFVAREAGAELVGNIGGHTAVANNTQIVEAVAQGVASAVSAVLGNGNRGGQTIQMVVDGKVLYQTVVNENNRQIQRTGASALRA